MLATVLAAEPGPVVQVATEDLERLCMALAVYTDLKGLRLIGHSTRVAQLAGGAGDLAGMEDGAVAELRRPAP